MFKRGGVAFFTALILCAQSVSAQTSSFGRNLNAQDAETYKQVTEFAWRPATATALGPSQDFDIRELKQRLIKGGKVAIAQPTHASQTMLQIFILSLVEGAHQNAKINLIQGQEQLNGIGSLTAHSAYEIANSFELYGALIGGSIFSAAFKAPLEAIKKTLTNNNSKAIFGNLIHAGMSSFTTFVGWELGAFLWKEAIYNLCDRGDRFDGAGQCKNNNDILIAKKLNFSKVLFAKAKTPEEAAQLAEERRIFANILDNMYILLTYKRPDLTKNWIYNTWRLKIQTGEFTTLLVSMVAGSKVGAVAGTAIAPGAGTLVMGAFGFAGGLVGGLMWIAIPQGAQDSITDAYKLNRLSAAQSKLDSNTREILRIATLFDQGKGTQDEERQYQMLKSVLDRRMAFRNEVMTVLFEKYYTAYTRKMASEELLAMISQYNNLESDKISFSMHPKTMDQLLNAEVSTTRVYTFKNYQEILRIRSHEERKKEIATAEMKKYEDEMVLFYENEALNQVGPLIYNPIIKPKLQEALNSEMSKLSVLHQVVRYIVLGASPEKMQSLGIEDVTSADLAFFAEKTVTQIEANNLRAYEEARYLKLHNKTNN